MHATSTPRTSIDAGGPEWRRQALRWLRRPGRGDSADASPGLSAGRLERAGITDNGFNPIVFFAACPSLRQLGEGEGHARYVTAAHRCGFAPDFAPDTEHQIVFCLTNGAYASCPRYAEPVAALPLVDTPPSTGERSAAQQRRAGDRERPPAAPLLPNGEGVQPRSAAIGESAVVTPVAAALVQQQPPALPAPPPDRGAQRLCELTCSVNSSCDGTCSPTTKSR